MYPTYLIHYNKNHDPKTGQFAPGDGNGDGIRDNNAHRSKKKISKKSSVKKTNSKKSSSKETVSKRQKQKQEADEVLNDVLNGFTNSMNTISYVYETDPNRKFEKGMDLMLNNSKVLNNGKNKVRSKSDMAFDVLDDLAYAGQLYLTSRAKPEERFGRSMDLLGYTMSR